MEAEEHVQGGHCHEPRGERRRNTGLGGRAWEQRGRWVGEFPKADSWEVGYMRGSVRTRQDEPENTGGRAGFREERKLEN